MHSKTTKMKFILFALSVTAENVSFFLSNEKVIFFVAEFFTEIWKLEKFENHENVERKKVNFQGSFFGW